MSTFAELVARVAFPCFPIPISMSVVGGSLKIIIPTKDRERIDRHTMVMSQQPIPPLVLPRDEEAALRWIYEKVAGLLEHELREAMTVGGRRLLDPHLPT